MKNSKFKTFIILAAVIASVLTLNLIVSAIKFDNEKITADFQWNDWKSINEETAADLSLEEIHNILYVYETERTTINRDETGRITSKEVIYTAEEAAKYRILNDIYISRMTYAYEYLNRNTGLDTIIGLPWYAYEVIDGEFYIIVEKNSVMNMNTIMEISAERKIGIDTQKLNDELQKLIDDKVKDTFDNPTLSENLSKHYDVIILDDGKWAFKAMEKVEDPEAVSLRLKLLNNHWEESLVRFEEFLAENGYK